MKEEPTYKQVLECLAWWRRPDDRDHWFSRGLQGLACRAERRLRTVLETRIELPTVASYVLKAD